ncbi:MAG: glycosyltransferase [Jaaginema sp. PMC 1079.18]|nr:glycosyltransferase [Jaaginema sp. PMC 1080.18]MEC4850715.1 glycosyltransferase [Jaaginema sp. PMC 1079.18]MEC4867732.1 glycosyltransferase [Jaaginema sp. PMC 1078.18]
MKIAFVDFSLKDYTVETAYQKPLGGSTSALCYLSEALSQQGHEVVVINKTTTPGQSLGVFCVHFDAVSSALMNSLEAVVVLNICQHGRHLRSLLNDDIPLIYWTQNSHSTPSEAALDDASLRASYDAFVFVSEWQCDRFQQRFGIEPKRSVVMRNAIAPVFLDLLPLGDSISDYKSRPPVLAYTSTPFRGLDLLLEVFPQIRAQVPGTTLKVFSSMKVYSDYSRSVEAENYQPLYDLCQNTDGIEYIGSIPQPQLARELQSATLLAYPNTFAETSCIAVMEAMASGCWVVTSDLGALAETTAGFGCVLPVDPHWSGEFPRITSSFFQRNHAPIWQGYKDEFIKTVVAVLQRSLMEDRVVWERELRSQIEYIQQNCTWLLRACQWAEWLATLRSQALSSLSEQAYLQLQRGQYERAAVLYEQVIELLPDVLENYWYLGLAWLLQGQTVEAEMAWFSVIMATEGEEIERYLRSLRGALEYELKRFEALQDKTAIAALQPCLARVQNELADLAN